MFYCNPHFINQIFLFALMIVVYLSLIWAQDPEERKKPPLPFYLSFSSFVLTSVPLCFFFFYMNLMEGNH